MNKPNMTICDICKTHIETMKIPHDWRYYFGEKNKSKKSLLYMELCHKCCADLIQKIISIKNLDFKLWRILMDIWGKNQ